MIFDWDCPANAEPVPEVDNLVDVQIGPATSTNIVIGRIAKVGWKNEHDHEDGWTLKIYADATPEQERIAERDREVGVRLRDDKVEKVLAKAAQSGPLEPYNAMIN